LPAIRALSRQIRDSGKIFSAVGWQPKIGCFSNKLKLLSYFSILAEFDFGINLALTIITLN